MAISLTVLIMQKHVFATKLWLSHEYVANSGSFECMIFM